MILYDLQSTKLIKFVEPSKHSKGDNLGRDFTAFLYCWNAPAEKGCSVSNKSHWENIYENKGATQVSWYQEHARFSLEYIRNTGIQKTDLVIDVGGGASTLVDDLVEDGFEYITVLDISANALQLARERLGQRAVNVNWIEADITKADL
jgi:2-polyprenyl-3-methyl-5-hydroxy-6-metoxy-1,4-benzoquinol methylase